MTIPNVLYPGTPPDPSSAAYKEQVEQITKMIGESAETFSEAQQMVTMLFVPDMSYHRGAISQALGELQRDFDQRA